jgi:nucleotide-binding universal stress UspA family protein
MTMIVGYPPDRRGRAALELAAMLARSAGDDLVVACVVPAPWTPGMARVDAEYRKSLDTIAESALEEARAEMPQGPETRFVRHAAQSAPAGLLELVEKHGARFLVVGSSSAGVFGHVVLGSVSDRLLHSSPVPVALAPRGLRCDPDAGVTRVSVAYGGPSAEQLVESAAAVAAGIGASLRLVSFAVWSRPPYTSALGTDSEDLVIQEWTAKILERARATLAGLGEQERPPADLELAIGRGESWGEALDDIEWDEGDVLLVGSSPRGPLSNVFLGSHATKIVRHSPVPVVVVPRGVEGRLAQRPSG